MGKPQGFKKFFTFLEKNFIKFIKKFMKKSEKR